MNESAPTFSWVVFVMSHSGSSFSRVTEALYVRNTLALRPGMNSLSCLLSVVGCRHGMMVSRRPTGHVERPRNAR